MCVRFDVLLASMSRTRSPGFSALTMAALRRFLAVLSVASRALASSACCSSVGSSASAAGPPGCDQLGQGHEGGCDWHRRGGGGGGGERVRRSRTEDA